MDKKKVVYVLGAGFSIEAGAPSQENLVQSIFNTFDAAPSIIGVKKMKEFRTFLSTTMQIPDTLQSSIPLEDIFTPLDRCILDNLSFRNLGVSELKNKRNLIFEIIGKTLQYILETSDKGYIDIFATHLISLAEVRKNHNYSNEDPVSVISTNWDILLDNSLHNKLSNQTAVVDYCCHISSYDKDDHKVKPGLEILGMGGFNVKLIKLHGSLNWLQCPKCCRLFVKFNEKIAMNPYAGEIKPKCRHCNDNFGLSDSHILISNLVMPTFLKDLSNPQYKILWQNAGIELSEAKKIVFIGYSLPQADFEMRQLLSRMIDVNTEIEVVDYKGKKDNGKFDSLISNYTQFFGRKVNSFQDGTAKYILNKLL